MPTVEEYLAEQNQALAKLHHFQCEAYRHTVENLRKHVHVARFTNPDQIFESHTLLAKFAANNGVASLAIECWPYLSAYGKIDRDFASTFPKSLAGVLNPQKTATAVNWAISEALTRIAAAPSWQVKAGVAAWLALRLRNSLLHVLESQLDIYQDETKCTEVFGLTMGVLRLVRMGEENTL